MPGSINFQGGDGIKQGGEINIMTFDDNTKVDFNSTITTAKIDNASGRKFNIVVLSTNSTGAFSTKLPILNNGAISIATGIHAGFTHYEPVT